MNGDLFIKLKLFWVLFKLELFYPESIGFNEYGDFLGEGKQIKELNKLIKERREGVKNK